MHLPAHPSEVLMTELLYSSKKASLSPQQTSEITVNFTADTHTLMYLTVSSQRQEHLHLT